MEQHQLEQDLENERKIRDVIIQANSFLEKKIRDLKQEIGHSKKQDPANGGTETDGYRLLQEQLQHNHKLEKNIELETERLRILSERNADITHMDLDILSQTELIRLVKQLERIRTDLQSSLREIEVNLDKTNNAAKRRRNECPDYFIIINDIQGNMMKRRTFLDKFSYFVDRRPYEKAVYFELHSEEGMEYLRLNETKSLYQAEIDLRERKRRQAIPHQLNTTR